MSNSTYILILIFTVTLVSAQSVDDVIDFGFGQDGYGIKAKSMGNAFLPVAEDYSAIFWNPAGLGQIKNSHLFFEGITTQITNQSAFYGNESDDFNTFHYPKAVGIVLSLPVTRGSLVFAGGYQQRKDFSDYTFFSGYNTKSNGLGWFINEDDTFYPFDKNVRQSEKMIISGGMGEYVFAGSIAMNPNLLIGGSVSYLSGKHNYQLEFFQDDVNNFYRDYPGDYRSYLLNREIRSSLSGWSGKVSFLFSFLSYLRVGGVIELPMTIHIDQSYTQKDQLVFDDDTIDESDVLEGKWAYDLFLPAVYSIGAAFNHPVLTLSVSGQYRELDNAAFSQPENRTLNSEYVDLYRKNRDIRASLRPFLTLNAGIQLHPGIHWPKFRAGYEVTTSPYSDQPQNIPYMETYSAGISFAIDTSFEIGFYYTLRSLSRASGDDLTPGIVQEQMIRQNFGGGILLNF